MQQIKPDEFIALSRRCPVLDVRSPGEHGHAHIPGAYSLPLFSDEERKVVGTLYKQEGRETAIKKGLDYFGVKMRRMVEEAEQIVTAHDANNPNCESPMPDSILLHCWRGGMRSAGVSWLLELYGFKVYTLAGGYKAYRNWVLQQFEKTYRFKVIGGYTGSGKTDVLKYMAGKKHAVIDLEGIAHHKGSAFGALGEAQQPGQEMFENLLAMALHRTAETLPTGDAIWLEDESRRIGLVNLPEAVWKAMQRSTLYFLDIPFEERLNYITNGYGKYKPEELVNAIMRIRKRLGGQNTKEAINYIVADNVKDGFRILLNYYDRFYKTDLERRKELKTIVYELPCKEVDAEGNYLKLTE